MLQRRSILVVNLVGLMATRQGRCKIARHEAEFDHRTDSGPAPGIEDIVDDGEIIDGMPVRIFGVDVCGAEFELRLAVARSEQMMHTDINRNRAEIVKLSKKLLPVWHGGVIGFVVAEPRVDGRERARPGIEIGDNSDRFLRLLRRIGLCYRERGCCDQTEKDANDKESTFQHLFSTRNLAEA